MRARVVATDGSGAAPSGDVAAIEGDLRLLFNGVGSADAVPLALLQGDALAVIDALNSLPTVGAGVASVTVALIECHGQYRGPVARSN